MVTQITDKLRQQTLEEISAAANLPIRYEQLRKASKERECLDAARKSLKTSHHRRSHTSRNIKIQSLAQDGPEGSRLDSDFTRRCYTYPPAKKRLCRSVSDPSEEQGMKAAWKPEPSSIWTPVKRSKNDLVRATGARSLEFNTSKDTFSWSTPPESPIPRPVSANSALGDSTFFPLRLISEESDNSSCFSLGKSTQRKPCSSFRSTISRSHSHPSFSTGFSSFANNGLKRRLSEVDIPRPALDFDKMKATSFANTSIQKRTVKSPKYSQKRQASVSPKNPNSLKSNLTSESCNISVDLDSSLMITPTASPTNIGEEKTVENEKFSQKEDVNANTSLLQPFASQKYLNYVTLKVDTDLDIKSIEEDGTLDDNEIHNNMLF